MADPFGAMDMPDESGSTEECAPPKVHSTPLVGPQRIRLKNLRKKNRAGMVTPRSAARGNITARPNVSMNSSTLRRTLRANNRALAQSLSQVRMALRNARQELLALRRENQELHEQIAGLHQFYSAYTSEEVQQRARELVQPARASVGGRLATVAEDSTPQGAISSETAAAASPRLKFSPTVRSKRSGAVSDLWCEKDAALSPGVQTRSKWSHNLACSSAPGGVPTSGAPAAWVQPALEEEEMLVLREQGRSPEAVAKVASSRMVSVSPDQVPGQESSGLLDTAIHSLSDEELFTSRCLDSTFSVVSGAEERESMCGIPPCSASSTCAYHAQRPQAHPTSSCLDTAVCSEGPGLARYTDSNKSFPVYGTDKEGSKEPASMQAKEDAKQMRDSEFLPAHPQPGSSASALNTREPKALAVDREVSTTPQPLSQSVVLQPVAALQPQQNQSFGEALESPLLPVKDWVDKSIVPRPRLKPSGKCRKEVTEVVEVLESGGDRPGQPGSHKAASEVSEAESKSKKLGPEMSVALRVSKPGQLLFKASRKNDEGKRDAVPQKLPSRAQSRSKKAKKEILDSMKSPTSIWDFADQTPGGGRKSTEDKTSEYDLSLTETENHNEIHDLLQKKLRSMKAMEAEKAGYCEDTDAKGEKETKKIPKAQSKQQSRCRGKSREKKKNGSDIGIAKEPEEEKTRSRKKQDDKDAAKCRLDRESEPESICQLEGKVEELRKAEGNKTRTRRGRSQRRLAVTPVGSNEEADGEGLVVSSPSPTQASTRRGRSWSSKTREAREKVLTRSCSRKKAVADMTSKAEEEDLVLVKSRTSKSAFLASDGNLDRSDELVLPPEAASSRLTGSESPAAPRQSLADLLYSFEKKSCVKKAAVPERPLSKQSASQELATGKKSLSDLLKSLEKKKKEAEKKKTPPRRSKSEARSSGRHSQSPAVLERNPSAFLQSLENTSPMVRDTASRRAPLPLAAAHGTHYASSSLSSTPALKAKAPHVSRDDNTVETADLAVHTGKENKMKTGTASQDTPDLNRTERKMPSSRPARSRKRKGQSDRREESASPRRRLRSHSRKVRKSPENPPNSQSEANSPETPLVRAKPGLRSLLDKFEQQKRQSTGQGSDFARDGAQPAQQKACQMSKSAAAAEEPVPCVPRLLNVARIYTAPLNAPDSEKKEHTSRGPRSCSQKNIKHSSLESTNGHQQQETAGEELADSSTSPAARSRRRKAFAPAVDILSKSDDDVSPIAAGVRSGRKKARTSRTPRAAGGRQHQSDRGGGQEAANSQPQESPGPLIKDVALPATVAVRSRGRRKRELSDVAAPVPAAAGSDKDVESGFLPSAPKSARKSGVGIGGGTKEDLPSLSAILQPSKDLACAFHTSPSHTSLQLCPPASAFPALPSLTPCTSASCGRRGHISGEQGSLGPCHEKCAVQQACPAQPALTACRTTPRQRSCKSRHDQLEEGPQALSDSSSALQTLGGEISVWSKEQAAHNPDKYKEQPGLALRPSGDGQWMEGKGWETKALTSSSSHPTVYPSMAADPKTPAALQARPKSASSRRTRGSIKQQLPSPRSPSSPPSPSCSSTTPCPGTQKEPTHPQSSARVCPSFAKASAVSSHSATPRKKGENADEHGDKKAAAKTSAHSTQKRSKKVQHPHSSPAPSTSTWPRHQSLQTPVASKGVEPVLQDQELAVQGSSACPDSSMHPSGRTRYSAPSADLEQRPRARSSRRAAAAAVCYKEPAVNVKLRREGNETGICNVYDSRKTTDTDASVEEA